LRWNVNALAELLPIALFQGIQSDIALELAREFSMIPEPKDIEGWPWPVKVYTLGRFDLLIRGETPNYSRKIPKKVLSLLKAIIALGVEDVPEQILLDALWSDEDGDAARRSLSAAVHRLRKLLANDNAIRQVGGNVSLDTQFCWVDAIAFENRLRRGRDVGAVGEDALELYRGAFLVQEDAPWALPMRERLRAKFIQVVDKIGGSYEGAGRYDSAIDLYLRGIEADHLIEPFYQGLMRCYDKLNRRTEAVSAYRRLRETLSITLGVPPSSASQRLFETMRLN
jgi:DNA-binding SARP family transcriptional activator